MVTPIKVDLKELEVRLEGTLPLAYRDLVRSEESSLKTRGFDPKTLLVLNLQLRSWEHVASQGRLFLNGDDFGNYYFTQLDAAADRVLLWLHESPDVQDPNRGLVAYLREAEQLSRIDRPVSPGILYICRTSPCAESILDPIRLEEWIAAVEATDGITYVGCREGRNPFTGEPLRIELPGLARVTTAAHRGPSRRGEVVFHYGRAELEDNAKHRSIAAQLAKRLHAHIESAD
jgi:hypothetical protein